MKLEAIIFDFDGTLADTLPLCISSFQLAFQQTTGREYTQEEITKYFGISEEGISQVVLKDKWEEGYKNYLTVYQQNHHLYPRLFDGIKSVLDHLKANNYKIALVTGKGKSTAEITLNFYGITDYFEYIETGSAEKSIKTESINKILSKWNISPEKVAYIGDATSDIIESKNAGVTPIAVSWASTSNHEELEKHNPSFIFSKTKDFKNWILSLKSYAI